MGVGLAGAASGICISGMCRGVESALDSTVDAVATFPAGALLVEGFVGARGLEPFPAAPTLEVGAVGTHKRTAKR